MKLSNRRLDLQKPGNQLKPPFTIVKRWFNALNRCINVNMRKCVLLPADAVYNGYRLFGGIMPKSKMEFVSNRECKFLAEQMIDDDINTKKLNRRLKILTEYFKYKDDKKNQPPISEVKKARKYINDVFNTNYEGKERDNILRKLRHKKIASAKKKARKEGLDFSEVYRIKLPQSDWDNIIKLKKERQMESPGEVIHWLIDYYYIRHQDD